MTKNGRVVNFQTSSDRNFKTRFKIFQKVSGEDNRLYHFFLMALSNSRGSSNNDNKSVTQRAGGRSKSFITKKRADEQSNSEDEPKPADS